MFSFTCKVVKEFYKFLFWLLNQFALTGLGKVLTKHFGNFTSFFAKLIITWLVGIILLIASAVIYTTLHYTLMPVMMLSVPVHFHFSCHEHQSCSSSVPACALAQSCSPVGCGELAGNTGGFCCCERRVCSPALARVSLLDGDGAAILRPHVLYTASVELLLPDSPVNQQIGMFAVQMNLTSGGSRVVSSVSRCNVLKYRSWLHNTARTLLLSPLLLTGYAHEEQQLITVMHTALLIHQDQPVTGVWLQLSEGKMIVHAARLTIHARLRGLRRFMYLHPLISSLLGTCAIFASLAATFVALWCRGLSTPTLPPQLSTHTESLKSQSWLSIAEKERQIAAASVKAIDAATDRSQRDELSSLPSCTTIAELEKQHAEYEPAVSTTISTDTSSTGGWMQAVTARLSRTSATTTTTTTTAAVKSHAD